MRARYDMQFRIANHDFYNWLVMAVANGATEIIFGGLKRPKETKWPAEIAIKRFHSIIEPGPAFLGLPSHIGKEPGADLGSIRVLELIKFWNSGRTFPRLRTVLPPRKERYTVSMRNDWRIPGKNSNEKAWRRFAQEIGAHVIEDYDVAPIHIYERMALYAGAEMNFGVVQGGLHLCVFADYPVVQFAAHRVGFEKHGMSRGDQYPWSLPGQSLVWEPDDYDVLMRWFENYSKRKAA